jgi:hypothetical protein
MKNKEKLEEYNFFFLKKRKRKRKNQLANKSK